MNRTILKVLVISSAFTIPTLTGNSYATDTNNSHPVLMQKEGFEPELSEKLRSVQDLTTYIDTSFRGSHDSYEFVNHIGDVISRRFYHNYSYYTPRENWMASAAGSYIWEDLAAIVLPDDIMKHPHAACSQQTIILMACARHFNIPYRKVYFDHHFAAELMVRGKWHFVDTDQEVIPQTGSLKELMDAGTFYSYYAERYSDEQIRFFLGHPRYGKVNEKPAANAELFHRTTGFLSHYFFAFLFMIQAFIYFRLVRANMRNKLV